MTEENKVLTTKDLIFMGYGCETTIGNYVKRGLPRHGVRGRYWFDKDEVDAWIKGNGEVITVKCPCCGEMVQFPKGAFVNG